MQLKRLYTSLLLSLVLQIAFSQVEFENINQLGELLTKAQQTNKLIFVQFKSENCNQCNDVAKSGLSSTKLKEKYAQNIYFSLFEILQNREPKIITLALC